MGASVYLYWSRQSGNSPVESLLEETDVHDGYAAIVHRRGMLNEPAFKISGRPGFRRRNALSVCTIRDGIVAEARWSVFTLRFEFICE